LGMKQTGLRSELEVIWKRIHIGFVTTRYFNKRVVCPVGSNRIQVPTRRIFNFFINLFFDTNAGPRVL
jgi:hypothetical protein